MSRPHPVAGAPALIPALVLTLALTLALALAGCGVPAQDEPHPVTLPRGPLTGPSVAVADPAGEVAQVLCLVRDGRLAQSVRRADARLSPQRHLDALVAGPTEAERAQGLSTALAGLSLTLTLPRGSATASVEVLEEGEETARSDEVLAYGQIVCTLTSRADVGAVTFTRAGELLRVPRGDGTLADEPLRAGDYRDLIGPA